MAAGRPSAPSERFRSARPRPAREQPALVEEPGHLFFLFSHPGGFRFRVMIIPLEVQKAVDEEAVRQDSAIDRLRPRLAKHIVGGDDHLAQKRPPPSFPFRRGRRRVRRREGKHVRRFVLSAVAVVQRPHRPVPREREAQPVILASNSFPDDPQAPQQRLAVQRQQPLRVFDEDLHSRPLSWERLPAPDSGSGGGECRPERA